MDDLEDSQLRTELDEISRRIDSTLKKIETLFEPDSKMTQENTD